MLPGLVPSVGTVRDAQDNGLAETTIGLCKTECARDGSPFRSGPRRAGCGTCEGYGWAGSVLTLP